MPNHLSLLGIIHTAISVLALFTAFYALLRDGAISPANNRGKLYCLLTVITCLTALPIMKTGHFTSAHGLAIIVLVILPVAFYAKSISILGKSADYIQTFLMSLTLFFSMIPAIVETLTRLPIDHPIADGPNASIIQTGLMSLVILFVVGVIYQFIKIKSKRKRRKNTDNLIKFGQS